MKRCHIRRGGANASLIMGSPRAHFSQEGKNLMTRVCSVWIPTQSARLATPDTLLAQRGQWWRLRNFAGATCGMDEGGGKISQTGGFTEGRNHRTKRGTRNARAWLFACPSLFAEDCKIQDDRGRIFPLQEWCSVPSFVETAFSAWYSHWQVNPSPKGKSAIYWVADFIRSKESCEGSVQDTAHCKQTHIKVPSHTGRRAVRHPTGEGGYQQ